MRTTVDEHRKQAPLTAAARVLMLAAAACAGAPPAAEPSSGIWTSQPIMLSADGCPSTSEPTTAKIWHPEYFAALASDDSALATVWLHPPLEAARSSECGRAGATDFMCSASDAEQRQRSKLLAHALECVLARLGPGPFSDLASAWYEQPYYLQSGTPVPVMVAFTARFSWAQLQTLAPHPYVEHIAPAAGAAAELGFVPAPVPAGCPTQRVSVAGKLDGVDVALAPDQRVAMIVDFTDEGVLPALTASCDDTTCDPMAFDQMWARALVNKRELTCVLSEVDAVAPSGGAFRVAYASGDAYFAAPALPPLGEVVGTVLGVSFGLTSLEAQALARHPYVHAIRSAPGLAAQGDVVEDCRKTIGPVPKRICPSASQAAGATNKFSAENAARWQAAQAPNDVLISVSDGAHICQLPDCPTGEKGCAAVTELSRFWEDENRAAQACVRDAIAAVGGSASPEVLWITNAFEATLTWDQLQIIARHPHVTNIESNQGGGF